MSTSWQCLSSSLSKPTGKRKSGTAKGTHPGGKKKKEKENEALVIQNMKPLGLDAFKKNEVTCLGEIPNDNDPAVVVEMMKKECHDYIPKPNNPHCREDMVEVLQEGVSYPQPSEEEAKETVQELMNELKVMDQATQTHSSQPPPEDDNEGFKRMVRMATIFQSPAFSSSVDYTVCPRHQVRLEERVSQNGWEYVKCPMHPCLLFFLC